MNASQEIPRCPLQSQHPRTGILWAERINQEEPKSSESGAEGDAFEWKYLTDTAQWYPFPEILEHPHLTRPYTEWGLVSRTHFELLRANQEVQSRLSQRPMADPFRTDDGLAPSGQSAGRDDGRDQTERYWSYAWDRNREGPTFRRTAYSDHIPTATPSYRQTWCSFEGCPGEAGTCHTDRTEDIH